MVSPSEEVSQPSSTPRLSVMSMKCLLHREPRCHFSKRKGRNFSPKRLRLKAQRSSTARPLQPSKASDPPKSRPGWSESGCAQTQQPTHWTCVVVAAGAESGQKSLRSAPEAGQRQRPGRCGAARGCCEAASQERAQLPPASGTYIKVTSTSLIKR